MWESIYHKKHLSLTLTLRVQISRCCQTTRRLKTNRYQTFIKRSNYALPLLHLLILIITYWISSWTSVATGTLLALFSSLPLLGSREMLTHTLTTHTFTQCLYKSYLLFLHEFHPVQVRPETHKHTHTRDIRYDIVEFSGIFITILG